MSYIPPGEVFNHLAKPNVRVSILLERTMVMEGVSLLCQQHGLCVDRSGTNASKEQIQLMLDFGDVLLIGLDELMATNWKPKTDRSSARRIVLLGDIDHHLQLKFWWRKQIGGIVVQQDRFCDILKTIEAVAAGERSHSKLLEFDSESPSHCGDDLLTRRQVEVLRLVSEGNSSKEIGTHLRISHKTVENHRATIYQRLGVRTAAEMVNVARRTGWL